MTHTHKPLKRETYCWTACVASGACPNPRAHGGVVELQVCGCGAERAVEANGSARVAGAWYEPPRERGRAYERAIITIRGARTRGGWGHDRNVMLLLVPRGTIIPRIMLESSLRNRGIRYFHCGCGDARYNGPRSSMHAALEFAYSRAAEYGFAREAVEVEGY